MKQNYFSKNNRVTAFVATLMLLLCATATTFAQTYTNGNLSTGATSSNGTAAPAGYTWSEVQTGNGTIGSSGSITNGFRMGDDFVIPAGQTWNISTMVFYGYQTGYASTTVSPFTTVHVTIHSGTITGPTVFGDQTTNRFASSANSGMYRIAPATPGTTRLIWTITATTPVTLSSGTYWIEYATDVTGGAAHFLPLSTVAGTTTQAGDNAQQYTGSWAALLDGTSGTAQDMPFKINYALATACTGTPAPGNTVSTAAAVCPGTPFTLSTQNAVAGSGVTYQWQSSSTGAAGSFTNIAGATGSTYTVPTQAASTYYQALVTCTGSASTTASTPLQVTTNPPSACYCTPAASNCSLDDDILNVTFGAINNNSLCSPNGYANYTALAPAQLVVGGTYPISVTIGPGGGDQIGVWIDYDHSGTFDASEFKLVGTTAGGTVSNTITVPASALTGFTRMRVRSRYATAIGAGSACTTYVDGETEDYSVNIRACVPATLTGSPTDKSVVCGSTVTFGAGTAGDTTGVSWEYRTSASGVWQNVPNAAPYSGVNSDTLTINPATDAMNGYMYRLVYSGLCSGSNVSSPATLTVTQIVATVTPAASTICAGTVQQLTLTNTLGSSVLLNEGFDAGIPASWSTQNRSVPIGPSNWAQGNSGVYGVTSHSGTANSYAASAYDAAAVGVNNTISNWLFTPTLSIKNGDVLTFWSRIPTTAQSGGVEYPDRLEVRQSSNGASTNVGATATSVGDFANLLLTINPTLVTGVYPQVWTKYTVTVSGVTGTVTGRIAFRVYDTDNGSGANEDYVALDDVNYTSTGASAQGVWTGPAGTIYTNAAGTTPYTGTPATSVYVKPTTTSTYSVSFTANSGGCTSTTGTATVTVNNPVGGTATLSNAVICANNNTSFALGGTLTGGPAYTHNFQVSTNNGVTFTNITNGGVYSGANTNTLTLTNVPYSSNGYQFRDSINTPAGCGSLISNVATLTVNPTPVVTISAAPITNIYPGLTSTLTAAVSSATAPITYQWFRNGSAVAGATSNTLTVGVDGEGKYTVRVTDANGCTAAAGTSTPSSITIGDSVNTTILFIYPSPNSGQFQVRYYNDLNNGGTAPAIVNVYDEKGSRVFTQNYVNGAGYQSMPVDLGTHGKGLYRVELLDLNGNRIKTGSVMVF